MSIAMKCVCAVALTIGLFVVSTAQADFSTAGTLYVDLDASTVSAVGDGNAPTIWTNAGTLSDFTNNGMTYTANVAGTGTVGVTGRGTGSTAPSSGPQTSMYGPNAVADIAGNSDRSIEIWAFNPNVPTYSPSYEVMFSYGAHNTKADVWFNQGSHGEGLSGVGTGAGALVHYGADYGWGTHPTLGQWNYLVYTNDGAGTDKLYVNGVLNKTESVGTLATSESAMLVNAVETLGYNGSMSYRAIRVHGGALSAADIQNNWEYGYDYYGIGQVPEPTAIIMLYTGIIGLLAYAWRKRK